MGKVLATDAVDCIDCYREELLIYLVQRFASLSFARRVFSETQRRLAESNILDCVSNPHIYLISYALSLGLELMQMNGDKQAAHREITNPNMIVHPCAQQTAMTGGEPWHSQAISTLH